MYLYNWITLPQTWNESYTVNPLYSNIKQKHFKEPEGSASHVMSALTPTIHPWDTEHSCDICFSVLPSLKKEKRGRWIKHLRWSSNWYCPPQLSISFEQMSKSIKGLICGEITDSVNWTLWRAYYAQDTTCGMQAALQGWAFTDDWSVCRRWPFRDTKTRRPPCAPVSSPRLVKSEVCVLYLGCH